MHPNPAFRREDSAKNLAFARDRAFGVLAINGDGGPLISHVPFLLNDDGTAADLHLVRTNPITRLKGGETVIAVSGPDGYVSPDWYRLEDQVPTWNYVAVHIRGQLAPMPDGDLRDLLDRQSAFFERRLGPKSPWTADKMTPEVLVKMMRAIQPFRLTIESVEGTWKLNQNKADAVRLNASEHVGEGVGQELSRLSELMRSV